MQSECAKSVRALCVSIMVGRCKGSALGTTGKTINKTPVIECIIWLVFFLHATNFLQIGNVIIPTDFHSFHRGRSTTNQIVIPVRSHGHYHHNATAQDDPFPMKSPVKQLIQWVDLRKILPGNHRCSHEKWDFPVIFPLNQSIDSLSLGHFPVDSSIARPFVVLR